MAAPPSRQTAEPPSRQTAAARSLHGAEQVDGSADAPATREQSSSSEATENALWDEAYDRMKSTNLDLVEKFEKKAMEAYHKLRKGQVSPQDASLHGLAAFPQDADKRRRLMQDMARLQLQRTHDDRAQKVRNGVKTAVQLFEVLEKELKPSFEATPLAGVAFGGLCLVIRFAMSGITVHEDMMQGLKHIAENSRWYLEKSKSSVFPSKSDSTKVTMSPLREILLNIFSTMLEYQVTSVDWSGRSFYNYFRLNPFPDLLSKLKEAENEFYRKATFDQLEMAQKGHETRRVNSFLKAYGGNTLKRLDTEEESATARSFAEWLVNEPGFESWEESCTGILSVTTTHQSNPALAKTLASTLKQRKGNILVAHFTSTVDEGEFSDLAKHLIHQTILQNPLAGDDLDSILSYRYSISDENLLLECFERVLAILGCTVHAVFVLDISSTASSELQEGFKQLVGKVFPVDRNTSHLFQVLITTHADVGLNQVLSPKHDDKTTYLLAPPLLPISQAPLSILTTSSMDAAGPTDTDTDFQTDIELVRYALLMVLGARRPLTLVELASSVAAYRALSAGSNVMETIGGKELLERLYKAGCLKYIAASYRRVTFLSCDDVREAAHEYGLGKDMLKRRGKLAVAEASTFYISQQVKGMEREEINHVAMSVASDEHRFSSVRNFAIHASFLCYAAEHSASQLSEFPIHGTQNGSLKLRPSLQETQQQLWEPGNFCLRYWYHRLNMAPPSVRGSHVPYQAYSRANGPISDDFGTKFFIAAAELGYQAFITTGLEHPENRNETNQYGHNALHIACIHRDIAMVKILLVDVDVDMFARDNLGFTPFHLAAHLAEPELLQVLFDSARARFGPVELQRFRAMFQESRPGCRPSFTSGHVQLMRRFLSSRNDTAGLNHWEAWTLCTCSHRYLFSATRMGSAMIYLACRRHPELMQALHALGIDERQLQQRFPEEIP